MSISGQECCKTAEGRGTWTLVGRVGEDTENRQGNQELAMRYVKGLTSQRPSNMKPCHCRMVTAEGRVIEVMGVCRRKSPDPSDKGMMGAASLVVDATPPKILVRDNNGEDGLSGGNMNYREVGGRTAEITKERRNGKVTRHESRSNTADDSGRGSKREKRGRPPTREAQNKMSIGIEANTNSSSTGWEESDSEISWSDQKVGELEKR